jgi:hypothetical protein
LLLTSTRLATDQPPARVVAGAISAGSVVVGTTADSVMFIVVASGINSPVVVAPLISIDQTPATGKVNEPSPITIAAPLRFRGTLMAIPA